MNTHWREGWVCVCVYTHGVGGETAVHLGSAGGQNRLPASQAGWSDALCARQG